MKEIVKENQKYGRLTANKLVGRYQRSQLWEFLCDCGNKVETRAIQVFNGHTQSCGCLRDEINTRRVTKHNLSRTHEYRAYIGILSRCNNKNKHSFPLYGGRGIKNEWKNFEEFYLDMGVKPSRFHSIDRIDNNGNYSKENCRWATQKEQVNNRRNTRMIIFNNKRQSLSEWAEELGMTYERLRYRIRENWPLERAMINKYYGK